MLSILQAKRRTQNKKDTIIFNNKKIKHIYQKATSKSIDEQKGMFH